MSAKNPKTILDLKKVAEDVTKKLKEVQEAKKKPISVKIVTNKKKK